MIKDTWDNKPASLKPLLDAIQPYIKVKPSRDYPDGRKASWRAGIIEDDSPDCIIEEPEYIQIQDSNERTEFTVTKVE